jgi:hypothetical protein
MRILAGVVALAIGALAGCPAGDDDYTQVPGGPGGPGEPVIRDASPDGPPDGGGATSVTSRVCILTDIRVPTACPRVAANVDVREQGTGNQTTTRNDGTFALPVSGTGVVVVEIGVGTGSLVPSLVPVTLGAVPATLPIASGTEYRGLVNRLGAAPSEGAGDVVVYYLGASNLALPGVAAAAAGAINPPYYDIAGSAQFDDVGATGAFGAALLVTLPEGTNQIAATAEDDSDLSLNAPVAEGHLTFATARTN